MDTKTCIDSGAIYLFPLNIQPSHWWTHSFGTHSNNTDVLGEIKTHRLEMTKKEPVRKSKDAVWLHVWEDFLIIISLQ